MSLQKYKGAAGSWWSRRTPPQRLAIFGVGIFVGYKLYQALKSRDASGGTADIDVTWAPGNLTYDDGYYSVLADGIEAAFYGTIFQIYERDQIAAGILSQLYTNSDVYKLIATYGVRGSTILTSGMTLPAAVSSYLDQGYKEQVNAMYQNRNMTFQWA